MGIMNVVFTAIFVFIILGGTLFLTKWLLKRFIDFFLQRKVK
jgi:hypothetical protein